jgi:hypothetical protein
VGLLMERGVLQRDDDLGGHEARPFARSRRTDSSYPPTVARSCVPCF